MSIHKTSSLEWSTYFNKLARIKQNGHISLQKKENNIIYVCVYIYNNNNNKKGL